MYLRAAMPKGTGWRFRKLGGTPSQAARLLSQGVTAEQILAQADAGFITPLPGMAAWEGLEGDLVYRHHRRFARRVASLTETDRRMLKLFFDLACLEDAPTIEAAAWCDNCSADADAYPLIAALPTEMKPERDSVVAEVLTRVFAGDSPNVQREELRAITDPGTLVTAVGDNFGIFVNSDGVRVGEFGNCANADEVTRAVLTTNGRTEVLIALGGIPELAEARRNIKLFLDAAPSEPWFKWELEGHISELMKSGRFVQRFGHPLVATAEGVVKLRVLDAVENAQLRAEPHRTRVATLGNRRRHVDPARE